MSVRVALCLVALCLVTLCLVTLCHVTPEPNRAAKVNEFTLGATFNLTSGAVNVRDLNICAVAA